MKIDYCAKIKAGLFLPAFTLMLELSGKTLAMCLFPGMPIVVEFNEAEYKKVLHIGINGEKLPKEPREVFHRGFGREDTKNFESFALKVLIFFCVMHSRVLFQNQCALDFPGLSPTY